MFPSLPLSVLLLARNEATRLASLLPSLGFARDVVVVVDPTGTDATAEVARAGGARVFQRTMEGFGPQRQFALEQCREDWVLWIDADERLDARAESEIRRAVDSPGAFRGYRLERHTWFLGKRIRHCGWQGERVLRLFRRAAARFDDAPVHECVIVSGLVGDLAGVLEHRSYETWEDCRTKLFRYAAAGAERARREGRRASVIDLLARPPLRFLRMYLVQGGVLDGPEGAAVCSLAAAQVFLKYAELWASRRAAGSADR